MPLFLITSVCDEGVYESSFKVVEAPSKEAIAQAILDNPSYPSQSLSQSQTGNAVKEALPRQQRA